MFESQRPVRFIVLGIAIVAISSLAILPNDNGFFGVTAPKGAAAASKRQADSPADIKPRSISVNTCIGGNTVEVEATAGTPGPTNYTTLKSAFDAVNAGTHQGNVTIKICANTNEGTTPATLNSTGAGPAAYASLSVFPANDGVSISGNPAQGFGVIQLKGADNVTINGDNPNTAGTNRNLTVANTATNTVTFNSVIRIANAAAVTSSDNDTIKNLTLNGNVTGGNASTIVAVGSSSNSSFGIYVGGNGGATATDAPTAIANVTTNFAPTGTTVNNLLIDNNAINQCARGVVFDGQATSVSTGVTISNNTIGASGTPSPATPPFTSPATTVYMKGIWISGTNAISITGNTIQNVLSYVGTTATNTNGIETVLPIGTSVNISSNTINNVANSGTITAQVGIALVTGSTGTGTFTIAGNNVSGIQGLGAATSTAAATGITTSYNGTSGLVEKNKISGVFARNTTTFGASGLTLMTGNNVTVQNNFISDVKNDQTAGDVGADPGGSNVVYGIKVQAGTGHKIYHNSVSLFGAIGGSLGTDFTQAFAIISTNSTGLDVRNNIFSNTLTGGNTSGNNCRHAAIYLPANGTSSMNLTLNNNDYYSSGSPISILGQAGTTIGTNEYLAANFDATTTLPATNMRAYTSTLSAAGTNDNASKTVIPMFVSNADLHIQLISTLEGIGANAGVAADIDGDARGATPDIGADEISPTGSGTVEFDATSYTSSEGTAPTIAVHRVAGDSSTISVAYSTGGGTATGGAACTAGVDYINKSGTLSWADGDSADKTFTVTLCSDAVVDNEFLQIAMSNPAGTTISGTNPVNLNITDVQPSLSGSYNVGIGGDFTSLTNAGGIFQRLNASGATSSITINITSDLAGETGTFGLNEVAGGFAVLVKPSGAPRSITGSNPGALIKINGADNVKIDGSTAATFEPEVAGGNPALRQLTIQNTDAGNLATVISVQSGANGAQNDTIQNINILGQDPLTTLVGISLGGNTPGGPGTDNDNNRVQNCSVRRAIFGIFSAGSGVANPNTGTVITQNDLTGTTVDRVQRVGILIFNESGAQVTENSVGGLNSADNADVVGIGLGVGSADDQFSSTAISSGGVTNALVERNRVSGVTQTNSWGAAGIAVAGDVGGANTIQNNMISGVISDAIAPDIVAGIFVAGVPGSTTRLYYNSVSMTGDRSALPSPGTGQYPSYGVAITGFDPSVELKDNIIYTTQTADSVNNPDARSFSIGMQTSTFANLNSNYNAFWSTGANDGGFRTGSLIDTGGSNLADLAAWNAATGDDLIGNSQEVDPLFVSTTDLHLQGASPVLHHGTPIPGVVTDFDNDIRSATTPDVGADEAPAASSVSVSGRVLTPDNRGLRNAVVKITQLDSMNNPVGPTRTVTTSSLGNYTFDSIATGQNYRITVLSKLFRFASRTVSVGFVNVTSVDFVGQE